MARARNIKPGFFKNEDLVELPFEARLLFIGLWTLADREGRLEDRPKKIKMELFSGDNLDVDDLLNQLAEKEFILRYEISGNKYIAVINFAKHQNPHYKEQASVIPAPDLPQASTRLAPNKPSACPADSLKLIPDSLKPITITSDDVRRGDSNKKRVVEFYSKNCQSILSPLHIEKLCSWVDDGMEADLVIFAIEEAVMAGQRRPDYIQAILKNLWDQGIRTRKDAEIAKAEFKASKNSGKSPPPKKKPPEISPEQKEKLKKINKELAALWSMN